MSSRSVKSHHVFLLAVGLLGSAFVPGDGNVVDAVELEVPLDVSYVRRLETTFQAGNQRIEIDLRLDLDARGRIVAGEGLSTVSVNGVRQGVAVKGKIKNRRGVEFYKLVVKSPRGARNRVSIKILGQPRATRPLASIVWKGFGFKYVRSDLLVTLTGDLQPVAVVDVDPEIDSSGRITGEALVVTGFGRFFSSQFAGRLRGDRISWSIKEGGTKFSFVGTRAEKGFSGVLKVKVPPAKMTIQNYEVDFDKKKAIVAMVTPHNRRSLALRRALSPFPLFDQNRWRSLDIGSIADAPDDATAVFLHIRAVALGQLGDERASVRINLRARGSEQTVTAAVRVNALRDQDEGHGDNIVIVPLDEDQKIEFNYQIDTTGDVDLDRAEVEIYVQGFLSTQLDARSPYAEENTVFQRDLDNRSGEGGFISVDLDTLVDVPEGAQAVALNLDAHAGGTLGVERTSSRLWVKRPGVDDPVGPAVAAAAAREDSWSAAGNLVIVPLDETHRVEFMFAFAESGASSDAAEVHAFIQGFLLSGVDVRDPYDAGHRILHRNLDLQPGNGEWQTLDLDDTIAVPSRVRAVVLGLSGAASALDLQRTELRLDVRAEGADEPRAPALRLSSHVGHANQAGNLVIVPLGVNHFVEYRYFIAASPTTDRAEISMYVQGFILAPEE